MSVMILPCKYKRLTMADWTARQYVKNWEYARFLSVGDACAIRKEIRMSCAVRWTDVVLFSLICFLSFVNCVPQEASSRWVNATLSKERCFSGLEARSWIYR